MENIDTQFAFDMHIDPGENQNWLFNPRLGKVYIKLNSVMTVTLSYKPQNTSSLFLRAMILYSSPEDMHLQVKRCANHRVSIDSQGLYFFVCDIFVRTFTSPSFFFVNFFISSIIY